MRRDLVIAAFGVLGLVLFARYFCMGRVPLDEPPQPALQGR